MNLRGKEHNPPHIHAVTQEYVAPFSIETGEIIEGDFPSKDSALVKKFILKNKKELKEMWKTGNYRKLPPLK